MYGSVRISCTCTVQVLCQCVCVRESHGLSVCPCASRMRMCVYIGVCEPVLLQLLHAHRAYNAQMQSVSIHQHTSAFFSIHLFNLSVCVLCRLLGCSLIFPAGENQKGCQEVIKQAQQTIESAESSSSGSDQGRARGQQTVLPKHAVEVFFSFFSFIIIIIILEGLVAQGRIRPSSSRPHTLLLF